MTKIERLKQELGKKIRDIAEGHGATPSAAYMSLQEERCVDDFEMAAGEWVYDLLKEATEYYGGCVREGPRNVSMPGLPAYINMDTEEGWASVVLSDILEERE